MMLRALSIGTLLAISVLDAGTQYIYPVGLKDGRVVWQHQQNQNNLSLMTTIETDLDTFLVSMCNPCAYTTLPNSTDFSFIDEGVIKVKTDLKRSAQSIDLDIPLINFFEVKWKSNRTGYISGLYKKKYRIVAFDLEGNCTMLATDPNKNYQYPNIIDNQLFYIVEDEQSNFTIEKRLLHKKNKKDTSKIIHPKSQKALFFLNMHSTTKGFFIAHQGTTAQKTLLFTYNLLEEVAREGWKIEQLFSFEIPSDLLEGPKRLYESLKPLIPYHFDEYIFFVDCAQTSYLKIYKYNVKTAQTALFLEEIENHCFAPLIFKNYCYYGSQVKNLDFKRKKIDF